MSLTICFRTFLKVDQHFNFALALPWKLQFQFIKLLFFIMKMTELACLFLFPLTTKHVIVTRSGRKYQRLCRFCGIFIKDLIFLKAKL